MKRNTKRMKHDIVIDALAMLTRCAHDEDKREQVMWIAAVIQLWNDVFHPSHVTAPSDYDSAISFFEVDWQDRNQVFDFADINPRWIMDHYESREKPPRPEPKHRRKQKPLFEKVAKVDNVVFAA